MCERMRNAIKQVCDVRVVHFRQLAVLQRRYIVPSIVLIESWTGYWSCLSGGATSKQDTYRSRQRQYNDSLCRSCSSGLCSFWYFCGAFGRGSAMGEDCESGGGGGVLLHVRRPCPGEGEGANRAFGRPEGHHFARHGKAHKPVWQMRALAAANGEEWRVGKGMMTPTCEKCPRRDRPSHQEAQWWRNSLPRQIDVGKSFCR